ncbi:MAG: diguanylate cyclase [bacterium]
MSYNIPDIDGLDLLGRIREIEERTLLPVIIVTESSDSDLVIDSLENGASDYVSKPLDMPVLEARVETQLNMLESQKRYQRLFEHAADAIFLMNEKKFVDCNQSTEELFEADRGEIIGQSPWRFSPKTQPDGRNSQEKAEEMIKKAYDGETPTFEWRHETLDGKPIDVEVTLNRVRVEGEWMLHAILRDITQRKKAREHLEYMARTDDLTGLYNRRHFLDLVEAELWRSIRYEKVCTFAMIDIDRFKMVNDQYGHQVGDRVLREVADVIDRKLRRNDRAGRYGGDEFAVILPETGLDGALAVGERIRKSVRDRVNRGDRIIEGDTEVSVSVGVAEFQGENHDEFDVEQIDRLIKKADECLYTSKRKGGDRVERRRHYRKEIDGTSVRVEAPGGEAIDAEIVDVSKQGVCLRSQKKPYPESTELSIVSSEDEDIVPEGTRGIIRWYNKYKSGVWDIGIELMETLD